MMHSEANVPDPPKIVAGSQHASAKTSCCRLALARTKVQRIFPYSLPVGIILAVHESHKGFRVTTLNVLNVAADPDGNGVIGESGSVYERRRRCLRRRKRWLTERHEQRRDFLACQWRCPEHRVSRGSPPGHIMPTLTLGSPRLMIHMRTKTRALYAEH